MSRILLVVLSSAIVLLIFAHDNLAQTISFDPGDKVRVIKNVNVRGPSACSDPPLDFRSIGKFGMVIRGPEFCEGYDRYLIRWENGDEGWSAAEDWLREVSVVDSTKFDIGDIIEYRDSTTFRNVRSDPPYLFDIGNIYFGQRGTVVDGPFHGVPHDSTAGFRDFWKIDYGNGLVGWSTELSFVEIPNQQPVADAGNYQPLTDSDGNGVESFTLDGSGSYDPDGSITSYAWYVDGIYRGDGTYRPVTLPVGTHSLRLAVTDNRGATDDAYGSITINASQPSYQKPLADAGNYQPLTDSDGNGVESLTLDGSGSYDPDGSINSYAWYIDGSYKGGGAYRNVTLPVGTSSIRLVVTDNDGLMDDEYVSIVVNSGGTGNPYPTADAGPDQAVTDSDGDGVENVTLNGAGSSDSDGSIIQYLWYEGSLYRGSGPSLTVPLSVGTHTIRLEVTDNDFLTDEDFVVIAVNAGSNIPPIANAGTYSDKTDSDGNGSEFITLDGSGSYDPDGTIVSYEWYVDGSYRDQGYLLSLNLAIGSHSIRLVVTDNQGETDDDIASIDVLAVQIPPSPPILQNPGTSSEPGTIVDSLNPTLFWSQVSGADFYAIGVSKYPHGLENSVWNPEVVYGTSISIPDGKLDHGKKYRWQMQAHGAGGWSAKSDFLYFQVADEPEPPNVPPIADFTITPQNPSANQSITFNASSSIDPDGGYISSYHWEFGDGIYGWGKYATHFYYLAREYSVTLTVTDNDGGFSRITKQFTVSLYGEDIGVPSPQDPPTLRFILADTEDRHALRDLIDEVINVELVKSKYDDDGVDISVFSRFKYLVQQIDPDAHADNLVEIDYLREDLFSETEELFMDAGGDLAALGITWLTGVPESVSLGTFLTESAIAVGTTIGYGFKVGEIRSILLEYPGIGRLEVLYIIPDKVILVNAFLEQHINKKIFLIIPVDKDVAWDKYITASKWVTSPLLASPLEIDILPEPSLEEINVIIGDIKSPGEFRVYDSLGNITGEVDGVIFEEIPNSYFIDGTLVIFSPVDDYTFEVEGTAKGEYGLNITQISDGDLKTFSAQSIPIDVGTLHAFSFDWEMLPHMSAGVQFDIDFDGDGILDLSTIVGDSINSLPIAGSGDPTSDGISDILDARFCFQIAIGLITPTGAQLNACDVNGDGAVTEDEAIQIAEYAIGLRDSIASVGVLIGLAIFLGMPIFGMLIRRRRQLLNCGLFLIGLGVLMTSCSLFPPGTTSLFAIVNDQFITITVQNMPNGGLASFSTSNGGFTFDPRIISVDSIQASGGFELLASQIDNSYGEVKWAVVNPSGGVASGAVLIMNISVKAQNFTPDLAEIQWRRGRLTLGDNTNSEIRPADYLVFPEN